MKKFFTLLASLSTLLTTFSVSAKPNVLILLKEIPSPFMYTILSSDSSAMRYQKTSQFMSYITQTSLKPFVHEFQAQQGINILSEITYLPITQGIAAHVSKIDLAALKNNPKVDRVLPNTAIYLDRPIKVPAYLQHKPENIKGLNEGLILHGIDKLIADGVDINKEGKIVGLVDTGVDGKHPALTGKVIRFKNFEDGSSDPVDTDEHGTHVSGIMAGGLIDGLQIGVYPGAKIVGAAALGSLTDMVEAWQWEMDPDGDPNTHDYPFVINNSWNIGSADPTPFYRGIETLKNADILICFSAGNAGSSGITSPHENPLSFASAAVDKNGKIADFSSWGPAKYLGQIVYKPDLATMGVEVYSSLPNGKYGRMSGTSMASPFTTGTIALLGSQFPTLSPFKIAEVLAQTTKQPAQGQIPLRLGAPKDWDKKYGYGILDAYAAYQKLKQITQLQSRSRIQQSSGPFQHSRVPTQH